MLSSAVDIIFELVNYIVMGVNYLGAIVGAYPGSPGAHRLPRGAPPPLLVGRPALRRGLYFRPPPASSGG